MLVACGVDHEPSVTPHRNQSGVAQSVEVKSQCVRRKPERIRDRARRHALRTGLNKQPEYIETVILGEGGKCREGCYFFHISTNIELSDACQELFR